MRGTSSARSERAELIGSRGLDLQMKDAQQCLALEPALAYSKVKPVGGTYAPSDESGDAHLFTRNLAQLCAQRGVQLRYDVTVERLEARDGKVTGVVARSADAASELLHADAVLVCLGTWTPFLLEPLGIRAPIYPVKGYSITVPVVRADRAPSVCLTDEGHKLAISRLGDRLRVAGTAELDGYDTTISERRCNALIERAKVLFPDAVDFAQAQRWAGLRPATPGNVPVIGARATPTSSSTPVTARWAGRCAPARAGRSQTSSAGAGRKWTSGSASPLAVAERAWERVNGAHYRVTCYSPPISSLIPADAHASYH